MPLFENKFLKYPYFSMVQNLDAGIYPARWYVISFHPFSITETDVNVSLQVPLLSRGGKSNNPPRTPISQIHN